MKKKLMKKENAITLIALVVTIVVLLILAAVSISMLTGENGIITQAQKSDDETEQAKCEELVTLAINGLITENAGDKSKITPQDIAEEVNRMENRTDVTAEENTFPTNILFPEEDREVGVNIELGVTDPIKQEIYNEPGLEEEAEKNIDLFLYEPIEGTGEMGATDWDSLPTKEARIIGMNPKYCNSVDGGYNSETGEIYENTNYEIVLDDGTELTDTLVVPYQVEIDGEMYKVTEVNLGAYGVGSQGSGHALPKVRTIIYPNTVMKITGNRCYSNMEIEEIILSNNLKEIGDGAFYYCRNLTSITIPNSVTSIGDSAFSGCGKLTSVIIPESVTSIGRYAFYQCSGLTNIEIPDSVTSIEYDAFESCTNLKRILVKINEKEPIEGAPWGAENAKVIYVNKLEPNFEKFANDFVKNKNKDELEELILKTEGFLGTFDEYLQEVQMIREEFEQTVVEDYGMPYLDALKFSLVYEMREIPWIDVEYQVYLKGGTNKTVGELEELFIQKCIENGENIEELEQFLEQEGLTLSQYLQQIAEKAGLRTEEDFLKVILYYIEEEK